MRYLQAKSLLEVINIYVLLDLLRVREVSVVSVKLVLSELEDFVPVALDNVFLPEADQVSSWLIKHGENYLIAFEYRSSFVLEFVQDIKELQALLLDLRLVYVLTKCIQHLIVPQYLFHIMYESHDVCFNLLGTLILLNHCFKQVFLIYYCLGNYPH